MASIAPKPLFLRNCTVSIGTDSYEKAINSVVFTPTSSTVTYKGLTPDSVYNFATPATWVAAVAFAQDWSTTGSLSNYLHEHEGESVTMTFEPAVDDTQSPTVTATITIVPGSIGGAQGAVATSSVSLPVSGRPEITPAV